ncbi:glycerate kinase family protein [Tissierella praeacuta]|uniref:glycerate kinase family protein n=1 Tax=Tissierella praeacuta TaxID=43131 RepID=UPI0028B19F49|nr:glycerate kinase [Tissierella praeacuta]
MDKEGKELGFGGGELDKLVTIDLSNFDNRLKDVIVEVACDVNNPLCGEQGASYVFGLQKGATPEIMKVLDNNLRHYGILIKEQLGIDVLYESGAGAAGGLGAGLMAFLNGRLNKGIDMVIKYSKLEEKLPYADMVWTGEGSIDFQTQFGKTPIGVAKLAKEYNKPVVALAGRVGTNIETLYTMGIDSIFSITRDITTLEEALEKGQENMEKTAENIIRLMNLNQ